MRPPTICHLLRARASETPDRIAYSFLHEDVLAAHRQKDIESTRSNGDAASGLHELASEELTNLQVARRAMSLAEQIKAQAKEGERVLLVFPPGPEFIVAFYACLLARVLAVPATYPRPNRPSTRLQAIIHDCQPVCGITSSNTLALIQANVGTEHPDIHWLSAADVHSDDTPFDGDDALLLDITADDVAFLQYTSGSTTEPKGVAITHGNLIHNLSVIVEGFEQTDFSPSYGNRTGVFWLPAHHDMGLIGGMLTPFFANWHSVLMSPASFLRSPYQWLKAISDYRAMLSGAPNFALDLCVEKVSTAQLSQLDLSCLRLLFCGAEPIRFASLQRFAAHFESAGFSNQSWYPCYGLAESTLMASGPNGSGAAETLAVDRRSLAHNQVCKVESLEDQDGKAAVLVACGNGHLQQQIAIVDTKSHQRLDESKIGEIWLAGQSVASGYWNRPDETREVFQAKMPGSEESWLRTGDLGFIHRGKLYVTGRVKDLIIIHGQNHYPQDIEHSVATIDSAFMPDGGAAFSIETEAGEQLVVVQEIDRRFRDSDMDHLMRQIRSTVADRHELDVHGIALIRQASLPRTTSGKVQRQLCRNLYATDELNLLANWRQPVRSSMTSSTAPTNGEARSIRDPESLASIIENWLLTWIRDRCGESAVSIESDTPFSESGLDSISAVELSFELEQWLKIEISPILAWNFPTPATLARHLAETTIETHR